MEIKIINNPNGTKEWMVIEVHGIVSPQNGKLDEKVMGSMFWLNKNTAHIVIGGQTFEGKITTVSPPMMAMRKTGGLAKEVHVEAIIRKKLVFKTRPKPLLISENNIPITI